MGQINLLKNFRIQVGYVQKQTKKHDQKQHQKCKYERIMNAIS